MSADHAEFSLFDLSLFDSVTHMAVMQAYFDASESADGYYTVAGYIFERPNVRPFERLWGRMIKDHPISCFHMTDCNQQKGEFNGMSKRECDQCARKAIHAISKRASQGIVVGIRVADFHELAAADGFMPSPFSLCAHGVLMLCSQWAEIHAPQAKFAYIFESGDDYQSDVNQLLNTIGEDEMRTKMFRYHTHAFHPKRKSYPVQAADVIAWHACKQWGRSEKGIRLRGDFEALVRNVETRYFLWSREDLIHSVEEPKRIHGHDKVGEVAGLMVRRTRANYKITDQKVSQILAGGE